MWKYDQSSGELSKDGKFVSKGYSGNGRGKNNPSLQAAQGIGPIPRGTWKMIGMVPTGASTGPYTIILEPMPGTDVMGRSAFRIHGDSISDPGNASHGCLILPRLIRVRMWISKDMMLEVVE